MKNIFQFSKFILTFIIIAQSTMLSGQGDMRWIFQINGSTNGSCSSMSNCENEQLCYTLEYTPAFTGTMTSYTTGFLVTCPNNINPIMNNATCVLTDNSVENDQCATEGFNQVLMNSSANNNSGSYPVETNLMEQIHQVCFTLGAGEQVEITEFATDLTVSITTVNGQETDFPDYTTFIASHNSECDALPVEWLRFSANKKGYLKSELIWDVTNQVNVSHYEVQYSPDGHSFEVAGLVRAKNAGASIEQYSFIHNHARVGANYYRIREVDQDGKGHISNVEIVNFDAEREFAAKVFPNPARTVVNIAVESQSTETEVIIKDVAGRIVDKLQMIESEQVDISAYASGVYYFNITTAIGESKNIKVVVVE